MRRIQLSSVVFFLALMLITPSVLAFETERPSGIVNYGTTREDNMNRDYAASVGLGVHIYQYNENHQERGDHVEMRVVATANTREILTYGVSTAPYTWYEVTNPTYITGDNEVQPVAFGGYTVRFYGGRRSAEYGMVFVCSNGFISFDSDSTSQYSSRGIPHTDAPNTFIAPFWRDLDPTSGGSITCGYVVDAGFVISWNEVPNKVNGVPQSFQVVLETDPGSGQYYRNSRIWFNYKSVTKDDQTTIGIEDQRGLRGVTYNYQDINNGMSLRSEQTSNSAFIQFLTIKLNKQGDAHAIIDINEDSDWIRGYNIRLMEETTDPGIKFVTALSGKAALLLLTTAIGPPSGLIVGALTIGLDTVAFLASAQKEANFLDIPPDESYAKAPAYGRPDYLTVVDASMGISVFWMFTDNNNKNHELTITAEFEYFEVDYSGVIVANRNITTSVPLRFSCDTGDTISTARLMTTRTATGYLDFYDRTDFWGYDLTVLQDTQMKITLTLPVTADFDLELYSENGLLLGVPSYNRGPGLSETILYNTSPASPTRWYVKVIWYSGAAAYTLEISLTPLGGGGGGCPYVSTWNGSQYLQDNNLIPAAEYSNGTDITDYYLLQQPMTRIDGKYQLLVWDIDKHSFLDHAQLVAIDHESDVKIAVSPDGQILTYKNPAPPTTAISKNGSNILALLSQNDGEYYQGYQGDFIELDFTGVDIQKGAKLVVTSDWCMNPPCDMMKSPTYIQVLNSSRDWHTVTTIYPRIFWSNDIIDLSEYLPDVNGELRVRISFTSKDKIDYVGLDATKQGEFELTYANLVTANHTRLGDVRPLLRTSDNTYVELLPGEQFTLQFTVPQSQEEKRDFIIILEGHYFLPG